MEFKYTVVLLLLFIGFAFIYEHYTDAVENFDAYDASGYVENKIIDLYTELLQREPTAKEIHNETIDIVKNNKSIDSIREQILNSDEYSINMKMQSNSLVPEIHKMVSDRSIIDRLSDIYTQELNRTIPSNMALPLRDLYIYLKYNEGAVRAMLRDPSYSIFEDDLINTPILTNQVLMDIFAQYFTYNTIIASGNQINNQQIPDGDLSKDYGTAEALGVKLDSKNYRSIYDTDTDSSAVINKIANSATVSLNGPVTFYDSNGNPVNLTKISAPIVLDTKGNPIGTLYDAGGHIILPTTLYPGATAYDANGKKLIIDSTGAIKDNKGNPNGTIYDSSGNIISATNVTIGMKVYDSYGNLLKVIPSSTTDSNGNPLGTVYDANGNIVPSSMLVAGMTVFDADGNQLTTSANLNELTDGARKKSTCSKLEYKRVMIPKHNGDDVLRPEMAWSVPNYNPPVCTSLGQDPLIQPVFSSTSSSLLLGTPLTEAQKTTVGSIMPKFTYKEYIDIPS